MVYSIIFSVFMFIVSLLGYKTSDNFIDKLICFLATVGFAGLAIILFATYIGLI